MKLAALYSGGKDSAFALYLAEQMGNEILALVNIVPSDKGSWIFHTPNLGAVPSMAEAMGLPLVTAESDGTEEKLHDANERLHRNTRRIVRFRYPFWTWRMFRLSYRLQRARAVALMVAINLATNDVLTRQAWLESNARRQLNSGEENW